MTYVDEIELYEYDYDFFTFYENDLVQIVFPISAIYIEQNFPDSYFSNIEEKLFSKQIMIFKGKEKNEVYFLDFSDNYYAESANGYSVPVMELIFIKFGDLREVLRPFFEGEKHFSVFLDTNILQDILDKIKNAVNVFVEEDQIDEWMRGNEYYLEYLDECEEKNEEPLSYEEMYSDIRDYLNVLKETFDITANQFIELLIEVYIYDENSDLMRTGLINRALAEILHNESYARDMAYAIEEVVEFLLDRVNVDETQLSVFVKYGSNKWVRQG